MSTPMFEGLGRRLALLVGVTALTIGFGASTAFAAQISISPTTLDVEELPAEVSVEGTEFTGVAEEDLQAGLCTVRGIGMFKVPACGEFAPVELEGEALTASVLLESLVSGEAVFANDHDPLPGHGATFDCIAEQTTGEELGCEIVVVDHSSMTPKILATDPLTFTF